jgi:type IX secretion system PorP/SprF family membrane protein
MKRFLLFTVGILILFFLIPETRGQDPNYSQYFNTPVYFNPATTGINTGMRARFTFRDQWPNLPVAFKSYYFSADIGDRNLPGAGGLGIIVNSDNEGISFIKNLQVGVALSVRIPISSTVVSQVGIKASVIQKRVNWDDFVFNDQLSERYGNIYNSQFTPPDVNSKTFPDFGAGGILQFSNYEGNISGDVGFAVDHIFQPDESFLATASAPLPRKYVGQLNLILTTGGRSSSDKYSAGNQPFKINPGILYQNQAHENLIQAGLNLLKYNVYLGGWFKGSFDANSSTAIALVAGYRYAFAENMNIKFMYSYDIQMSGNLQGMGGAHEISLILEFDKMSIFGNGAEDHLQILVGTPETTQHWNQVRSDKKEIFLFCPEKMYQLRYF